MKKQMLFCMAAGVAALGATVIAGEGNEGPKPEMLCIYKEVVTPSKMKEYEAAIKYMISEFKAYDIDPELVNFRTVFGPEIGYAYVRSIENFAAMDRMHEDWMTAIEIIGKEKFHDIMEAADAAVDHVDYFNVIRRADLSYTPENPRLGPGEAKYVHYSFYYAIPGKKKEIEELGKEYVELYKRNNIDQGWNVYESVTGTDLPVYVVAHPARSQGDFYRQHEELMEVLGPEAEEINQRLLSYIRRVEQKDGWMRPDLSYPTPEAVAKPSKR